MTDMLFRSPERLAIPSVAANSEAGLPNQSDSRNINYQYPHLPAYFPSVWRYPGLTSHPLEIMTDPHADAKDGGPHEALPKSPKSDSSSGTANIGTSETVESKRKRPLGVVSKENSCTEPMEQGRSSPKRPKLEEGRKGTNCPLDEPSVVHKSSSPEGSPLSTYETPAMLGKL